MGGGSSKSACNCNHQELQIGIDYRGYSHACNKSIIQTSGSKGTSSINCNPSINFHKLYNDNYNKNSYWTNFFDNLASFAK